MRIVCKHACSIILWKERKAKNIHHYEIAILASWQNVHFDIELIHGAEKGRPEV